MRKYILLILSLLCTCYCFAQKTVTQKNRLTELVMERYSVMDTNKQIKQGLYQAIYWHRTVIATGTYDNNVKTGIWHFFDTRGRLVENFDYDNLRLLYEEPMDSISSEHIIYAFDNTFKDTDHVTKPIKIGGRCYGYIPYMKFFMLSHDFDDLNILRFTAILELLISPGGRLADFKVHIKSPDFERITTFSTELIDDEDKIFIPATLNRKPILSRIFVKCRITDDGGLDVD